MPRTEITIHLSQEEWETFKNFVEHYGASCPEDYKSPDSPVRHRMSALYMDAVAIVEEVGECLERA